MKRPAKLWLIVIITIALALLACLVVLVSRPDEPVNARVTGTSRGQSFEVRVVKPRSARPLFGILPTKLEEKLLGVGELRFDNTSRGAEIGSVGQDRLELRADGWRLFIETDGEGSITPETRLVFPMEIGGRQRSLRCRPADRPSGYLHTTTRAGSDEIDGSFQFELVNCENTETGKAIDWPPSPLTVRGSFEGLPQGRR